MSFWCRRCDDEAVAPHPDAKGLGLSCIEELNRADGLVPLCEFHEEPWDSIHETEDGRCIPSGEWWAKDRVLA